jgi:hypothetical protein
MEIPVSEQQARAVQLEQRRANADAAPEPAVDPTAKPGIIAREMFVDESSGQQQIMRDPRLRAMQRG